MAEATLTAEEQVAERAAVRVEIREQQVMPLEKVVQFIAAPALYAAAMTTVV